MMQTVDATRRDMLGTAAGCAMLASGCGTARRKPGWITYLLRMPPNTLDPAKAPGGSENWIINTLFEPLLQQHPVTQAPIAGLATHYKADRDGTRYTFYLNFDAALTAASSTADPARRLEKLAACEADLLRAMPFIPLYFDAWVYLERPQVRGMVLNRGGIPVFKYAWIDSSSN